MKDVKATLALALAAGALVVSIVRGHERPSAAPAVDQQARDRVDQLTKQLAVRDAQIAQLTRTRPAADPVETAAPSTPAPVPSAEPRRYTHFETGNPAVTIAQKSDGTYDIRSTDPKLAGTVIVVTAMTAAGEEDKMYARIPDATN